MTQLKRINLLLYLAGGMMVLLLGTAVFLTSRTLQTPTVQSAELLTVATLPEVLQPDPTATATPTARSFAAKAISQNGDPRPTWTVTPLPTPTIIPTFVSSYSYTDAVRPFGVADDEKWIDVNLSSQTLTAFEGDQVVYSTLISSGLPEYATVTGQFRIWLRFRSQTMDGRRLGYDYVVDDVPYVMYFYKDYAIHGAYWHNNFGTPMSHGCVNMHPDEAQWLYNWADMGTFVNVHY